MRRIEGPYEDLIRPHDWSFAGGGSGGPGITTLPHIRDLIIKGPFKVTGISDTPSRQKIFTCRPTLPNEEQPCARQIIARLGAEAYRRPLSGDEIDRLLPFYETGAAKEGFEGGVRTALEAILASPHFIFRLEREPGDARPGGAYRIADADLASRLSFFLWGTPPDHELLALAAQGKLTGPTLEKQARRMLADSRADALGSRFAAQWLRLQDVEKVHPDPNFYPNFDNNVAASMRRETELFFNSLVREDRSVLDLYRADYTFVDERLARHYGFQGVTGDQFRRVPYPDDTRRGLLGQGSILVQTSLANRTSPVLRGKWVMEVAGEQVLGPGRDHGDRHAGPLVDQRRDRPVAAGGHQASAPIRARARYHLMYVTRLSGALGRAVEHGVLAAREAADDPSLQAEVYEMLSRLSDDDIGRKLDAARKGLEALMKRPEPLVRTFTENLLAYALGRRTEYFDQPTIRAIVKAASANDYRMSSFILGVIKSDAFLMKRVEVQTTTEDRQGR